jgi:hypothetical protein
MTQPMPAMIGREFRRLERLLEAAVEVASVQRRAEDRMAEDNVLVLIEVRPLRVKL